ncbi:MAG: acylneuraminate cytidylyltransferase family protein [Gammaproteobacteria bacterium]|nr:acylneuraminate cytidylyltransferase family protein [Gammaproteobacteria bacterium]
MIALIPARSGSKGLPGKNIKLLRNRPLISYTIDAAKKSQYISEVIISTDDREIADVGIEYGAVCPFMRPNKLASDESLAIDAYTYTIERLKDEFGYKIDDFIVLQPTSPLRTTSDIDAAIELFKQKKADSVISFCEESHPIEWNKYIDKEGRLEGILNMDNSNRQEYRKTFFPNGAIYVFKYDLILDRKYYSDSTYAYIMPRKRSVDIDTIDDFNYTEFLLRKGLEK